MWDCRPRWSGYVVAVGCPRGFLLLMSSTVTKEVATPAAGDWESSRRDKLQKIAALGHDPWGSRFDDHTAISQVRARAGEIVLHKADGQAVAMPTLETPEQ